MIRKIIAIVMLVALVTVAAYALSYDRTIYFAGAPSTHERMRLEAVQGHIYLHYVYSDKEDFLDRIDDLDRETGTEHETGYRTYRGADPACAAYANGPPDANAPLTCTVPYGWSYRVRLPLWLAVPFATVVAFLPASLVVVWLFRRKRRAARRRKESRPLIRKTLRVFRVAVVVGLALGAFAMACLGAYLTVKSPRLTVRIFGDECWTSDYTAMVLVTRGKARFSVRECGDFFSGPTTRLIGELRAGGVPSPPESPLARYTGLRLTATTDSSGLWSISGSVRTRFAWGVAVLLAIYPTIAFVRGAIRYRRYRRRKRGFCANCGYDLTGNVTGVCSECGVAIDAEQASATG